MKFNNIMHLSFYVEDINITRDFYENKLGLKPKIIMYNKDYLHDKKRPYWAKQAEINPDGIAYIFIEICDGQYLEFFPKMKDMKKYDVSTSIGYNHFALMVDDIFEVEKELKNNNVSIDIAPNIGQSQTWQMWIHDPDGNKFEIMQYTKDSLQYNGNV